MKKIFVDYDQVLYDIHKAHNEFTLDIYGETCTEEQITHWNYLLERFPRIVEAWNEWSHYSKGELYEGAKDFILDLSRIYGCENVIILTNTKEGIIKEKTDFLSQVFPHNELIHSKLQKKHYSKGGILIDDNIDNIKGHVKNGNGPGIIFDRGYGWNQERIEEFCPVTHRTNCYKKAKQIIGHYI